MKSVFRIVIICLLLCLRFSEVGSAENKVHEDIPPVRSKPNIQVIDSLMIDLSKLDSTICIDGNVVLSFDSDSIFACEWINMATGDTISREKILTVSPTMTTQYMVNLYYFTGELIKNGDFEDVSLPENKRVDTKYRFGSDYSNYWGVLGPEGTYRIGKSPRNFHRGFYNIGDHTSGRGNMMVVNGDTQGNVRVWRTTVNVEKGRTYAFSTWGVEVGRNNPAKFHFTINGETLGKDFQLRDDGEADARWEQFYELWIADGTTAEISLVNLNKQPDGNDFAIDDISFASMKKLSGKITVKVLPNVELGKLKDVEVCEGGTVQVGALATGSGTLSYKWVNSRGVAFGSGPQFSLGTVCLSDADTYFCTVTGECGPKTESFRLDVREQLKIGKLRDTVRPCDEGGVSFKAGAQGYKLTYSWTKPPRSQGWLNEKTDTYSKSRISYDRDTGTYSCRIRSMCGDTTVYRVLLEREKLKITDWPGDQKLCMGGDISLVVGTNVESWLVSWLGPNSEKLSSTTSMSLQHVAEKNVGVYTCNVYDQCLKGDSRTLILTIAAPMTFLRTSRDTVVCEHGRAVLRAEADGLNTQYEWSGPGNFTARTAEIVIDPVTPDRIGEYRVVATDSCGNIRNGVVRLSLYREYDDLKISPDVSLCPGDMLRAEVTGGKKGMTYDWTLPDGRHMPGAVLNVQAVAGRYVCKVSGVCQSVEKEMQVTLKETLEAAAGMNMFRVCPGEKVSFVPALSGTNVRCEWWKDGSRLTEGLNYTLDRVKVSDAGSYECRVYSDCGHTNLYYQLQVRDPLQIESHSATKYVKGGEKASLFVSVSGDSDRSCQWFLDGNPLKGENASRIDIVAPNRETTLKYTFVVSGCNTEEVNILVYVRDFETIVRDTVVQLCEGSNYSYRVPEKAEDWCVGRAVKMCWVYEGKDTIASGNAITFTGFRNRMVGEYVYTVESECGKEVVRLRVDSMRVPEIVAIHCDGGNMKGDSIFACMGGDIQLVPETKTYGAVVYEWSKDGVIIAGATGAVLKLGQVTQAQEGRYACRVVSVECGEAVREVVLKVYKKLSITYLPELEKCPGERVVLEVQADASVPSVFAWSGPEKEGWVAGTDGFSASYKNMAIRAESDGVYECRVTNVCGEELASIRLAVEQEILLPQVTPQDTICPGEDVEIRIPLQQNGVTYTWTLPDQSKVEQEVLMIHHFSEKDTGTYHYVIRTKNSCFTLGGDVKLYMRPELQEPQVSRDTAVCEGQGVSFVAFADGKDVEYEWWGPQGLHFNGRRVVIDPVTARAEGVYEVVVTDACDRTGKRGKVRLSLLKEFDHLVVSRDTGVCEGETAGLKVSCGTAGLSYEWKFKGEVMGQEPVLLIDDAKTSNSGAYACRISGTCQSVERLINLEVYGHLKAEKLDFVPVCVREDVLLKVVATGKDVRYRWMKDGEEQGDRTDELVLNDVIPQDTGMYECRVSSLCGDTTLMYSFTLKENTAISYHSADRVLCVGDDYELRVEATGENNRYTWICDGEVLAGNESVINCKAPAQADTLIYVCRVEGDCSRDSVKIVIKVGNYHKIKKDLNDTLCEGSNYKYNVDVVPQGAFEGQGFNYCWTFNGEVLQDGENSIFALTEVAPEDAGEYHCRITTLSNAPEFKEGEVVLYIDVIGLPRMVSMSPDIYAIEGSSDSIRVNVAGDLLTYSWTVDGENVDHTGASWYFKPISYEDRGRYEVTVANECSHVTARANVEVWRKTVIVFPQERADSVCLRGHKELEVIAWGEVGLRYKWYLNGQMLDVPLVEPLIIKEARSEDAGMYVCVVSGRGGEDSCKIYLNVLNLPHPSIATGKFRLCPAEAEVPQLYTGNSDVARVSYNWQATGGEVLGAVNWGETSVQWDSSEEGQLTLRVTSLENGCSDSITQKIEYMPVPDVNLVVPPYVGYCQDTLKITAAYPWGGIFTVNGISTDVVRFTDKDASYAVGYFYTDAETGCGAGIGDTIRVADEPFLRMAQDTVRSGWCAPVELSVSERSPGSIVWGGKQLPEVVDETHAVYRAGAYSDQMQKFWAVLTDVYHCQASDTVNVLLLPSPEVRLMRDTAIGVCNDLLLKGSSNVTQPKKIEWLPTAGLEVLDDYTAELVDKKEGKRSFVLAVTDGYGCVGRDTVSVSIQGEPVVSGREICVGSSMTVETGNFAEYAWDDGYAGNVRVLRVPGFYHLEVTDRYGCKGEADYLVHSLPVVHLVDTMVYEGQKMEFTVEENTDYPPYEVVWQDGSRRLYFTAEKEGYYSVKVTDNIGCSASDTAFLTVKKWYISAPDAFLPASRAENSRFYLKEVNFGSHFEMFIYDRWGELIFKTDEIGFKGGWDGTFKGINCQPGAYVWVAFVDGKEVGKGTLMLVK